AADDVSAAGRLAELDAAYASARRLAERGLHFVVPTLPPRSGEVGVRHGRHLLTVTAYLEGENGPGPYADDGQRALIARQLGELHRSKPPRPLQPWQPGPPHRELLEHLLEESRGGHWANGPFGERARVLLRDNRTHLEGLVTRFDELAASSVESRGGWVVTHGRPHSANVLWSQGGPLLVDWESVRLAPRERDLRDVLRDADGAEPLSAYVASGGTAELDADMVELFDLEWWLGHVGRRAARFALPHTGSDEDERDYLALRDELSGRRRRRSGPPTSM
ncbi:MAG: aminoglycoside phosphotransferase family protein, partial [Actinomycetota bacterium]|nr:aminoglycoside phosphotransferase family protein [Actinomycetota bacterium]